VGTAALHNSAYGGVSCVQRRFIRKYRHTVAYRRYARVVTPWPALLALVRRRDIVVHRHVRADHELCLLARNKAARCATTSGFDPLVASASAPRGDTNMRPVGAFLVGDIVSQRLVLVWVSTWSAHSLSTRSCGYRMCSRVVPPPPPSTWTHWWIRSQPCPLHRLRRRMPTGQRVQSAAAAAAASSSSSAPEQIPEPVRAVIGKSEAYERDRKLTECRSLSWRADGVVRIVCARCHRELTQRQMRNRYVMWGFPAYDRCRGSRLIDSSERQLLRERESVESEESSDSGQRKKDYLPPRE